MKKQILILDTSAIFSGKPLNFNEEEMITTPSVSNEISPGGKDYRYFQFIQEKGLLVQSPSNESIKKVKESAKITGDIERLSKTDIDLLALALDLKKNVDYEVSILSDDYSIQNLAIILNINVKNISKKRITKNFKWYYRCPGCGKQFKGSIKICSICGSETKITIGQKRRIK
jgi:UPF0271 protein